MSGRRWKRQRRFFFYFSFYNAAAGFESCPAANRGIGSRDRDADKIAQPPPTIYKVPLARCLGVTLVCCTRKQARAKKEDGEKRGKECGIAAGIRANLKAKSRALLIGLAPPTFPQILIGRFNSIK